MLEYPSDNWKHYELLDSGNGEKLERFGPYVLRRPEPKAIWTPSMNEAEWRRLAHTSFTPGAGFGKAGKEDSGTWNRLRKMEDRWHIKYSPAPGAEFDLRLGLTSFKHVGVFPEQAPNWNYIYNSVKELSGSSAAAGPISAITDVTSGDNATPYDCKGRASGQISGQACDFKERASGQISGQACDFKGRASGQTSGQTCDFKERASGQISGQACDFKERASGQTSGQTCDFKGRASGQTSGQTCDFKERASGQISGQACDFKDRASGQVCDCKGNIKVLNLFAYTGAASLAARAAGADVTHLDSVRQVVTWARENMEASGLDGIRWIVEDAMKFAKRESRRGNVYDGIILDPPAYGHGPDGEKWKLDECLFEMLQIVSSILKPKDSFLVLNLYSNGFSAALGETVVRQAFNLGPSVQIESGELALKDSFGKVLPLSTVLRLKR